MRSVTVYKRANGWFLNPDARTVTGLWQSVPPFLMCALDSRPFELGNAVTRLLEESKQEMPHPAEIVAPKPLLELAGVRSWSAFAKGASHVGVSADGDWITFDPSRNAGPRTGFLYGIPSTLKIPANSTPEEIGESLIKTLAFCL